MLGVRVLGQLAADWDGRPVDLGGPRQRGVLAILLAARRAVVSSDRIVDDLWAGAPPPSATASLQTYVSNLRRLVEPGRRPRAPARVLVSAPPGYAFRADDDTVDAWRFECLVGQARGSPPETARALLDEALGLWHGPAYAEFADEPWAAAEVARLEELRLLAAECRLAAMVRSGAAGEAVPAAEVFTREQPLREEGWRILALALWAGGRPADALAALRRAREMFAAELGLDAGPALAELEGDILAQRTEALPQPAVPVPRQLPAPPRAFTGRARELAALDAAGDDPITVVSGTAGVGKTALAVHWAHRVAGRFADGQLYLDLRGFDPSGSVMAPAEAVRGLLDALGVPAQRIPAGLAAQAGLYRSLLAGRRMLIVLDNARDAAQVRPLLPGAGGCMVLVTSRSRLTGLVAAEGAHPLAVDVLTDAEARDLLVRRLGADRLAAEPAAVGTIIGRCAGLPLALALVAARAAIHPGFGLGSLAGEPGDDVQAVFSWSYRTLDAPAARLFRLLGLHPGPDVSTAAAASLAGLPVSRVRPLLAALADANLVTEPAPGRYGFHDLLRRYARELADGSASAAKRHAATHRLLDHYLHTAHGAAIRLHPHRDRIALPPPRPGVTPERHADAGRALAWFGAEHRVLLTAVQHAAATGFAAHTWRLAWSLWTFLDRQGHRRDLLAAGRAALQAAEDPAARAASHRLLGAALRLDRQHDAHAHLRQALDLYRLTGDLTGQANAHNNLAGVYEGQGRYREALDHARQSLDLYRAAGHRRGHAQALNTVGWYHTLLGDHRQAVDACEQALAELQEIGDGVGQAMTWHSLGHAYRQLGRHRTAIAACRRALKRFREAGDRYLEADTLRRIGDIHHAAGHHAAARDAWRQVVPILDGLGHADADLVRAQLASE